MIDILVKIDVGQSIMLFRSTGIPFDPTELNADSGIDIESFSNIEMLHAITSSIKYERILGLNCIKLNFQSGNERHNCRDRKE